MSIIAARYDGAYGVMGVGVPAGDYRVPGTSMTPHQWSAELRVRARRGLDLAGQPLHQYGVRYLRTGLWIGSYPTHRGAAIVCGRQTGATIEAR